MIHLFYLFAIANLIYIVVKAAQRKKPSPPEDDEIDNMQFSTDGDLSSAMETKEKLMEWTKKNKRGTNFTKTRRILMLLWGIIGISLGLEPRFLIITYASMAISFPAILMIIGAFIGVQSSRNTMGMENKLPRMSINGKSVSKVLNIYKVIEIAILAWITFFYIYTFNG